MAQTFHVDHRNTRRHSPYGTTRTPAGRVTSAFEPSPPEHRALARDLAGAITGEVRFDGGSRGLYATDASNASD